MKNYLAPKLKFKIQILQGVDAENDNTGGLDRTYRKLIRIWAGKKAESQYLQAVRSVNTIEGITDEFLIRWNSIIANSSESGYEGKGLGREFNDAFDGNFHSIQDIYPTKADYFIFLEEGNQNRGRLYKIKGILRDDEYKTFMKIKCSEVEEVGLGAPA